MKIIDIEHNKTVDMSIEELEEYAKTHNIRGFRNKDFIDYLTTASDVHKLDDIPLNSALHILRMINVYEVKREVDEFIENGLGISLVKIAKEKPEIMESLGEAIEKLFPERKKEYDEMLKKLEKEPVPILADLGDIYSIFQALTDYMFVLYDNANLFYDEPELKIKETVFEVIPMEVNPDKIKKLDDLTHKDAIRLLRVFNSFRRKDTVDKFLTDIGDFEDIYEMFALFVGHLFHEYADTANFFMDEPELNPKYKAWQTITFGRPVRLTEE